MTAFLRPRSPMMALIIKDIGLCKPAIIAGVVSLVIPAAAASVGWLFSDGLRHVSPAERPYYIRQSLGQLMLAGLALASLTLPVVAATAQARERRERSGEFLRTMPIRRSRIVLSKAFVVTGWTLALWLGGLAVAEAVRPPEPSWWQFRDGDSPWLLLLPALALSLTGSGWLLGSFMRSETIAASVCIGGNIVLVVAYATFSDRLFPSLSGPDRTRAVVTLLMAVLAAAGTLSVLAGTVIALRRTSP